MVKTDPNGVDGTNGSNGTAGEEGSFVLGTAEDRAALNDTTSGNGEIPRTGSDIATFFFVALGLIACGVTLRLATRSGKPLANRDA